MKHRADGHHLWCHLLQGGAVLPYLILMAVLLLWALFLLPGQPIRPVARSFFLGGLLCVCAEGMIGSLLGVYVAHARLIADPERDVMLAGFMITTLLHPLMAVIYARLAPGRWLAKAVGAAVALCFLEYYFFRSGYMVYRLWHPAVSGLFYLGFLTVVWCVHSHRWPVPNWVHVLCMALWLVNSTTYLLHGVLGLWQYPVVARGNPVLGSQLALNLYMSAGIIPIAMLSSGILPFRWHPLLQVAVGTAVLVAAQEVMHGTGMVLYHHWNLWLSVALYAPELGAVALYARWTHPEAENARR